MKHGWEIKKFENCIGKIPKPQQLKTSDYKLGGKFPIVSQEACMISGFTDAEELVYHTQTPVVVFGDHTRILKYVDFDFVVGADGVKILVPTEDFNCKFFYYYLTWYDIPSLGYSRHYKLLKEINIPIPPLSIQERIVSELDCINGILEKKREQIKELDALAQSIFYDMFGDPIQNEKGWEVKKFADCYKLRSGNGLSAKDIVIGKFPVYGGNGIVGYHNEFNLDGENIIIGRVGALCGNVRCVKGQLFVTDNAFILSKSVENNNVFLQYLLTIHNLRSYAREAMQPVISNTSLKNIDIILPPLSLQQAFAAKIEAIEKQKELVKRSIAETETLLASRMQHYFSEE